MINQSPDLLKSLDKYWRWSPEARQAYDSKRAERMKALVTTKPETYKLTAERVMNQVDALPPALRALVHEHGWANTQAQIKKYGPKGALAYYELRALGLD